MNQNVNIFLNKHYSINNKLIDLASKLEAEISDAFEKVNQISQINQYKVLKAMQNNRLGEMHFHGSTGYGYDDAGREVIDKIYAEVFGAEDALVRYNFLSGTHVLTTALFGLLRPGDTLLAVTGKPYDSLDKVIGIKGEGHGSLKEFGVNYKQVDLKDDKVDYSALKTQLNENVKVAMIQRSKGYSWRPSLDIAEIESLVAFIKKINPNIVCFIDNCYGEFVEEKEPTEVGADICVGSLIKNPGGGIAETGGYIVGKKDLIEKISYRLTCPGIGKEFGATLGSNRSILQGLFFAPLVVGESLKGAIFTSKLFETLGFDVSPKCSEKRTDIIQSIKFEDKDKLIAFCQAIQAAAPVDSFAIPEPWDMPGYDSQVIMAAGTFTQGASIELSADAPIRPPFIGYLQGGLAYSHVKLGALLAAQRLYNPQP